MRTGGGGIRDGATARAGSATRASSCVGDISPRAASKVEPERGRGRLPSRATWDAPTWCVARLLLALVVAFAPNALAQSDDEQPCRADYKIEARYDDVARRLAGKSTIAWRNESRDDVADLWFHLYWNAFANDRTTHLRPTDAGPREFQDGDWGWTRITSLVVDGQELAGKIEYVSPDDGRPEDRTVCRVKLPKLAKTGDLVVAKLTWEAQVPRVRRRTGYKDDFLFVAQWFPKLGVYETGNGWNCHQFHTNTEFFADYGTYVVDLDLPARYEGKIGASGVQAMPSQSSEGRIRVRFTAPSEKDAQTPDRTGRTALVHDFAWTADPDYVAYEATFHYDEWAARHANEVDRVALALDRTREEMRLRDVRVTVLLQPDHVDQGPRHFEATCTALFFYGLWFGEYPYEHVTCVDPAWGAPAGGMEYPTLFTAGTRMFTRREGFEPESVVVHECGHQFWYGLVGNNEFEAAWLDEGFNTFSQNSALWLHYGARHEHSWFAGLPFDGQAQGAAPGGSWLADVLSGRRWRLPAGITLEPTAATSLVQWWRDQPLLTYARQRSDPRESERIGYLADPATDPVDMPAWTYCDRSSYRTNSYRRTATALRSLQGLVGDDRFARGMRAYSERWRYRHPYPQDFFDAFAAGAKVDVSWYFEQAFRSTATLDWSVDVAQKRVGPPRGWFPGPDGEWAMRATTRATPGDDGDADADGDDARGADAPSATSGTSPASATNTPNGTNTPNVPTPATPTAPRTALDEGGWRVDVVVKRRGELLLPLTIALTWDDGTQERLTWSREEQTRKTWWKPLEGRPLSSRKLRSAVLDPDGRYSFDLNLSDNRWYEATDTLAPLRWSERVFAQTAAMLHWWGGFGG